jgi:hypothetical protein
LTCVVVNRLLNFMFFFTTPKCFGLLRPSSRDAYRPENDVN